MANFEAFHWVISSSTNLLFLKSALFMKSEKSRLSESVDWKGGKTLPCLRINHAIVCFGTFVMGMRSNTTSEKCSTRVTGRSSVMYMIISHILAHLTIYFPYEFLPFSFFFNAYFTFYCHWWCLVVVIWIWWGFHILCLLSRLIKVQGIGRYYYYFFAKCSYSWEMPSSRLKLRLRKLVIVWM